jgi:lysophospholipase L1-like esterase
MLKKSDLPYWSTKAWVDAKAFNPTIVVLKLGTNDSKLRNWVNKSDFSADMQSMIDTLRALPSKPTIYLCSPARAFSQRFGIRDSIITTDIIPMVQQVAKKNGLKVIDLYAITKDHPEIYADEIHPNETGAGMLAKEIFRVLGESSKK